MSTTAVDVDVSTRLFIQFSASDTLRLGDLYDVANELAWISILGLGTFRSRRARPRPTTEVPGGGLEAARLQAMRQTRISRLSYASPFEVYLTIGASVAVATTAANRILYVFRNVAETRTKLHIEHLRRDITDEARRQLEVTTRRAIFEQTDIESGPAPTPSLEARPLSLIDEIAKPVTDAMLNITEIRRVD